MQIQSLFYSIGIAALCVPLVATAAVNEYTTDTFLSKIDSGTNTTASNAYLDEPGGFDIAPNDVIYIADTANHVIEKISPKDRKLKNVAGTGRYGYADGKLKKAQFASPKDIVSIGKKGKRKLYVADTDNNAIRRIRLKKKEVDTIVSDVQKPEGVAAHKHFVFISDTGNDRILRYNTKNGKLITLADDLSSPTKLIYWPKAKNLIFVNSGEGTVRSVNVSTKKVSKPIIEDLEDIGGVYRSGRNLYISSSRDIGVYNEIWKVALKKPNKKKVVHPLSIARKIVATDTNDEVLSDERETEQLNTSSDIDASEDELTWEEYNSWTPDEIEEDNTDAQTQADVQGNLQDSDDIDQEHITCLPITKYGTSTTTTEWTLDVDPEKTWQSEQFVLSADYQGDNPYFRVQLMQNESESEWVYGRTIRSTETSSIHPVRDIADIKPEREKNIYQMDNGDFVVTLKYKLPKESKLDRDNLQANVELCANNDDLDHPDSVTVERLYVLYKGGSAILTWHDDGTNPRHFAGKHRFQDEFGKKKRARIGRPKAVEFSPNKKKMYISQNNKISVYNFKKKKLTPLAGHLMDSYTEDIGEDARFSDITDMAIAPKGKWLYVADRNNNRIRKVHTKTGETKYVTGAGYTNYGFTSTDGNGYQEGVACPNVFDDKKTSNLDRSSTGKKKCAYFYRPTGIAISPNGKTLYIAEGSSNRIRAVKVKTGKTQLIAGTGEAGFVDGSTSEAQFDGPYSIDVSSDGNTLYVADKGNNAIRVINLENDAVTTLAGDGRIGLRDGEDAVLAIPEALEEKNGTVYWTEAGSHTVRSYDTTTGITTTLSGTSERGYTDGDGASATWNNPKGFDIRKGKLFIADYLNDVIRTVEL